MLAECRERLGLDIPVQERVGEFPSPTILVDGIDVMTDLTGAAPVQACRLDLPTTSRVLAALRGRPASPTGQHRPPRGSVMTADLGGSGPQLAVGVTSVRIQRLSPPAARCTGRSCARSPAPATRLRRLCLPALAGRDLPDLDRAYAAGVGRVLVVDDDETIGDVVRRYLERDGLAVEVVADGTAAVARALADPPDAVVLDLMLPGMSGLDVCRQLRASGTGGSVPIVMLTALGEESDRVLGLEIGADDYVTKPFSPRELALRVQSVLRRSREPAPPPRPAVLRDGDLVVDVAARRATVADRPLLLTVREFDLLAHPGGRSLGPSCSTTSGAGPSATSPL